jgi:hypothetical protein
MHKKYGICLAWIYIMMLPWDFIYASMHPVMQFNSANFDACRMSRIVSLAKLKIFECSSLWKVLQMFLNRIQEYGDELECLAACHSRTGGVRKQNKSDWERNIVYSLLANALCLQTEALAQHLSQLVVEDDEDIDQTDDIPVVSNVLIKTRCMKTGISMRYAYILITNSVTVTSMSFSVEVLASCNLVLFSLLLWLFDVAKSWQLPGMSQI